MKRKPVESVGHRRREPARSRTPSCAECDVDRSFLSTQRRPKYETGGKCVRVADIFSGCGAFTLGFGEAARRLGIGLDIRLAIDNDAVAAAVFRRNFPKAKFVEAPIERCFDGEPGEPATLSERRIIRHTGAVDVLLAGPPCQGHSNLNNHTRRDDPRNDLYAYAVRAVEVLHPAVAVIENVPAVRHDVARTIQSALDGLAQAGYTTSESVLELRRLGAPQSRRRHVVVAARRDGPIDPNLVWNNIEGCCGLHRARTVEWAIADLLDVDSSRDYDRPSIMSAENTSRTAWLFDHKAYDLPNDRRPACHRSDHSYRSMYGRLKWDEPAQTVTTGFSSMGQGRYVHPLRRRTLTPHEAARIQMIPDFFDFGQAKRTDLARLIGNAVPPALSIRMGALLLPQLVKASPRRIPHSERYPKASSPLVSTRMKATKRENTNAEARFRSALDDLGISYLANIRPLTTMRTQADFVIKDRQIAVFVNGCFWHGCPVHGTWPKTNAIWWREKILANRRRDMAIDNGLREAGWTVLRVWAHDDPSESAVAVRSLMRRRASRTASRARHL